jgi:hypothetical protein
VEANKAELQGFKEQNQQLSNTLAFHMHTTSLVSDLQDANAELSMKVSDLEDDRQDIIAALTTEKEQLAAALKVAHKEGRQLTRSLARVTEQSEVELKALKRQLRQQLEGTRTSVLLDQKKN